MKLKLLLLALLFNCSISIFSQTPVKLSSGQFGFAEGPVWDRNDNIYFSDISNRKVETYSVTNNTFATAFSIPGGRTNGLMFNKDLDLIICEFSKGEVSKRNTTGTVLETYASGIQNANDLCLDKKEGIYVTSPNSGNVYYISPAPASTLTTIDATITSPNGVIVSIDGTNLFVNDSDGYDIYKYDINPNTGLVSNRVVFATLTDNDNTSLESFADGMALDTNGNLYVTTKKSIQVFNTLGVLTNTFTFAENPTNCTFGGADLGTLYVTTPNDLYSISLSGVTGFQHPFDLPDLSLSVNELEKFSFNMFPNPILNHRINIEVGSIEIKDISLYNNIGQKIEAFDFTRINNSIQVNLNSSLTSNIYILYITTSDGSTVTQKIILD